MLARYAPSSETRSVIADTTWSAANPSSSGSSAALRWIQKVVRPAEVAPAMSQALEETKPSAERPPPSRSGPRS